MCPTRTHQILRGKIMDNYVEEIKIRLSKSDKDKIRKRAAAAGYGDRQLSKYVRDMCLKGKVVDYSELRKLTIEVNRIGHNVNQATRIMNTYFDFTDKDFSYIQDEVIKIRKLVEDYCKSKK